MKCPLICMKTKAERGKCKSGDVFDGIKQCCKIGLHNIEFFDSQANENDIGNEIGEGKSIAFFFAGFESDDNDKDVGNENDEGCVGFGNKCGQHRKEGHGAEQFIVECPKQTHKCTN